MSSPTPATFDVVRDFSSQLPIGVVAELVGVRGGSERMLRRAAATFDLLGPLNRRAVAAMPTSLGLLLYTLRFSAAGVSPRSWAAAVFDAPRPGSDHHPTGPGSRDRLRRALA
jgi:hypothetical protein